MYKGIEWLAQMINAERETLRQRIETGRGTPNENTFNEGRDRAFAYVLRMIQHLDKPEVLSQEWIDEHEKKERLMGPFGNVYLQHVVPSRYLKKLLVPKQEELESKIQELIESYKQEEDAYSNPENGWIGGFIEDLKNLVEKEQKYYILGKYDTPILFRDYRNRITETSNLSDIYPKANSEDFEFTEQEIKDYDPRYWAFAEPVE